MRGQFAGKIASVFLESKLTPLLMVAALAIGGFTLTTMPSEEEPQIIVPLADLYLPLPGATPEEVENRILIPLENVLTGIEGVEYVYSHAQPGFGLITVRYEVGRDMAESLVHLHNTLFKDAARGDASPGEDRHHRRRAILLRHHSWGGIRWSLSEDPRRRVAGGAGEGARGAGRGGGWGIPP